MPEQSKNRPELSLSDELVNFFGHQFSGQYQEWLPSEKSNLGYFKKLLNEYASIRNLEGQKLIWEDVEKFNLIKDVLKSKAKQEVEKLEKEIETRTTNLLARYKKEEIKIT